MVLKEGIQPVEVPFALSESGVNTFTEDGITLPVTVEQNRVFDLDLVEFRISPSFDPIAAGDVNRQFQFTLNDQTGLLAWNNSDVIAAMRISAQASAALLHSGVERYDLHMDTRGRANLIARNAIRLAIQSVNTTAVGNVQGRLIGSIVQLSQKNVSQLVLAQLS